MKLEKDAYKKLCNEVHERDQWKCRICKKRTDLHCHHVKFRSQSGDDADYNLLTLCDPCHRAIHDRHVVIRPLAEGEPVDANGEVKFLYLNGWTPRGFRK